MNRAADVPILRALKSGRPRGWHGHAGSDTSDSNDTGAGQAGTLVGVTPAGVVVPGGKSIVKAGHACKRMVPSSASAFV
jgi:hypothetical protein